MSKEFLSALFTSKWSPLCTLEIQKMPFNIIVHSLVPPLTLVAHVWVANPSTHPWENNEDKLRFFCSWFFPNLTSSGIEIIFFRTTSRDSCEQRKWSCFDVELNANGHEQEKKFYHKINRIELPGGGYQSLSLCASIPLARVASVEPGPSALGTPDPINGPSRLGEKSLSGQQFWISQQNHPPQQQTSATTTTNRTQFGHFPNSQIVS